MKNHSDKLRHKFKAIKNICISSVTYAELYFSIENGDASMREARWAQLDVFTQRLLIDSWDEDAARYYGFISTLLKKQGNLIGNTKLPPTKVGGLAHSVLMTNVINLAPSSARMSQNMKIKVTV